MRARVCVQSAPNRSEHCECRSAYKNVQIVLSFFCVVHNTHTHSLSHTHTNICPNSCMCCWHLLQFSLCDCVRVCVWCLLVHMITRIFLRTKKMRRRISRPTIYKPDEFSKMKHRQASNTQTQASKRASRQQAHKTKLTQFLLSCSLYHREVDGFSSCNCLLLTHLYLCLWLCECVV